MNLPRLHPEDLKEIINGVSNNTIDKLEEIIAKQRVISELQTLSVSDCAKILNKHDTTIARYIKNGLLVASKIGKDWIITQHSLKNFIDGKQ